MPTLPTLTLYTSSACPFAQRVKIALHENDVTYRQYLVDLSSKPEWYTRLINPGGKVPAITFGGPETAPDEPSENSVKLYESLVLLELVMDLFPSTFSVRDDSVKRAHGRLFVHTVNTVFTPSHYQYVYLGAAGSEMLYLEAVKQIQALLPEKETYVLGDTFTFADAVIAPWMQRLDVSLQMSLGKFSSEQQDVVRKALQSAELERFAKYKAALLERESVKDTLDKDALVSGYKKLFDLQ